MDEGDHARLRLAYEQIALAGVKRIEEGHLGGRDQADAVRQALPHLERSGLVIRENDTITLQRPEYATPAFNPSTRMLLQALYEYWLRANDSEMGRDDEVLWGDAGYWQHWWNMLHENSSDGPVPLHTDAIVDSRFGERPWLTELDSSVINHVVERGLVTGRLIVPPSTIDSLAEGFIDFALSIGVAVRVLPILSPFVVYNGVAVVLPERDQHGVEGHRLTRRSSIVQPLQHHFELRWAAAIPWNDYRNGTAGVLHLLARGWSDARIADALQLSARTVSRRVADAMVTLGAQSRFELGMKYALSEIKGPRP